MLKKITLKTEQRVVTLSGRDKVMLAFSKNKKIKHMSIFLVGRHTGIPSGGYLTNIVKELCMDNILKKQDCPTCITASVYSVVK